MGCRSLPPFVAPGTAVKAQDSQSVADMCFRFRPNRILERDFSTVLVKDHRDEPASRSGNSFFKAMQSSVYHSSSSGVIKRRVEYIIWENEHAVYSTRTGTWIPWLQ